MRIKIVLLYRWVIIFVNCTFVDFIVSSLFVIVVEGISQTLFFFYIASLSLNLHRVSNPSRVKCGRLVTPLVN